MHTYKILMALSAGVILSGAVFLLSHFLFARCTRDTEMHNLRMDEAHVQMFVDEKKAMSMAVEMARAAGTEMSDFVLEQDISHKYGVCREYSLGDYRLLISAPRSSREAAFRVWKQYDSRAHSDGGLEICTAAQAFKVLGGFLESFGHKINMGQCIIDTVEVSHDGKRQILSWVFLKMANSPTEQCRGSGIVASVNAYRRELESISYVPIVSPEQAAQDEISPEMAMYFLSRWLHQLELPPYINFKLSQDPGSVQKVMAYPIRLANAFYYAGNRTNERTLQEYCEVTGHAYSCWEIRVHYTQVTMDAAFEDISKDELYWVDSVTGEIIGGAPATKTF